MQIKTAHINLLEGASVSLIGGQEAEGFPLYRLYDRSQVRMFEASMQQDIEILIDQGATADEADALIISSGHNLQGATLGLYCSDDGLNYQPAVTDWMQEGTDEIVKTFTPQAKRYYKFVVNGPQSAPQITEMFLTKVYAWERNPKVPYGPLEPHFNVIMGQALSGEAWCAETSSPQARRRYEVIQCASIQKDEMLALYEAAGGGMPFWVCGHDGKWLFGTLSAPMMLMHTGDERYDYVFDFKEAAG